MGNLHKQCWFLWNTAMFALWVLDDSNDELSAELSAEFLGWILGLEMVIYGISEVLKGQSAEDVLLVMRKTCFELKSLHDASDDDFSRIKRAAMSAIFMDMTESVAQAIKNGEE